MVILPYIYHKIKGKRYKIMTTITAKVSELDNLNQEQLQAIQRTHNAIFYAQMSDNYRIAMQEEQSAKQQLKQIIPNLVDIICDFYNSDDTLILNKGE
jgi:hypothetical protein